MLWKLCATDKTFSTSATLKVPKNLFESEQFVSVFYEKKLRIAHALKIKKDFPHLAFYIGLGLMNLIFYLALSLLRSFSWSGPTLYATI